MSSDLKWYEDDDTTPLGTLSFAPNNGVQTDPQEIHLSNDGTTESEEMLITAVSRPAGSGDFSTLDEAAANGYVKIRLIGQSGGASAQTSIGYASVGRGRYVRVRSIPSGGIRHVEVVLDIPFGAAIGPKDVKLRIIEGQRAISLEMGHYEGGAQGIVMGLGDKGFTAILEGYTITPNSPEDNTVLISRGKQIMAGVPSATPDENPSFNDEDSAAVALSSGEEYIALLTKDGNGDTVVTKSLLGTAPLDDSQIPATPDGHKPIGYVRVPFSAEISSAEIEQDLLVYDCAALEGTSLLPLIHPFEMMVGNNLVVAPYPDSVELTDDDVNYIFANPSGSVTANTTGVQPQERSALLYSLETASGAIVDGSIVDHRHFLYPNPVEVVMQDHGSAGTGDVTYGVLPPGAQAYLCPIGGVTAAMGDPGTTSDSTVWDIGAAKPGESSFTSIFDDSVQFPEVAYDAETPVDTNSFPQTFSYPGGTRFKAEITAEPGGGTPAGQMIVLRFSKVGAAP